MSLYCSSGWYVRLLSQAHGKQLDGFSFLGSLEACCLGGDRNLCYGVSTQANSIALHLRSDSGDFQLRVFLVSKSP